MILVIGLDGADWGILRPWFDSGDLPVLAGLWARSRFGKLRSTIRPESSTAWATFATGVNPGRHGIFGFSAQDPASYEYTLNTARAIRYPAFWQSAAQAGKRLAIFNVPMTYPPQPLERGAVVAGMLSPGIRSDFTYPPELREGLLAAAPGYVINVDRTGMDLRHFLQATTRAIAARGQAAQWLVTQEPWDAAVVTFTSTDRLQHYALHLCTPDHPRYDATQASELLPMLLEAYKTLDKAVGRLLDSVGPDTTLIVLSDHGFAPCARLFYPNVWLEQQGWLHRHSTEPKTGGLWQSLRGRRQLRRIKQTLPFVRDWRRSPQVGGELASVDWAKTRAVYSPGGGIRLNVRDREPQGILERGDIERVLSDLSQTLLDVVDPVTGTPPIQAVYRREDLYDGPYLPLAPDLIIEPRRQDSDPARNTALLYEFSDTAFAGSADITGNHTLHGLFMAAGPNIVHGPIENARLIDMAPTLLHAMGLPVPRALDGQVLPLWQDAKPVMWSDEGDEPIHGVQHGPHTYDPEDQATIEERLRALGYL